MEHQPLLLQGSPDLNQFMPQTKEDRIVKALEQKRRALDSEIAQFKARKDDEYTAYEFKLRNSVEAHSNHLNNALSSPSSVMLNGYHGSAESLRDSVNGETDGELIEELSGGEDDGLGELDLGIIGSRRVEALETHRSQLNWSKKSPSSKEVELRDAFAPSYLPLLEKSQQISGRFNRSPLSSPSTQLILSTDQYSKRPQLSSSATLPSTPFDPLRSPPRTGPFSSSVPRPNTLQAARSSSRSDLSITSLRSSLKRPQTPRSSKHVLFAIDNHVLSPSTSPVARRRESVRPPIPFAGLTDMPKPPKRSFVLEKDDESSADVAETGTVEQIEDVKTILPASVRSLGNASPATTVALPSSIICYDHLVEPVSTHSRMNGDDFERIGRDDDALFSFDEEVDEHELEEIEVDKVSAKHTGI